MRVEKFRYAPDGKVLNEFFWDRSPVSIIQGPIGSGTSTACCFKLFKMSQEQKPDRSAWRRTRNVVIRNTYADLRDTTLKTWRYWFVERALGQYGDVKMTNPPRHEIEYDLPDGTKVSMENLFLALDQEDDIRKLLSLEPTVGWFNEMQFTEKPIFDTAHSRVMLGRYPPLLDGGPTFKGIIGDLNAPPEGHWIPYMRGDIALPEEMAPEEAQQYAKPPDWKFFVQPPGLIEIIKEKRVVGYAENTLEEREARGLEPVDAAAENTKWLSESYLEVIKGKTKAFIDTFVMNRVGMYREGRPVFENFVPEQHIAKEKLEYNPDWPLILGADFARYPAVVMCQMIRGTLVVLDEFGMENVSAGTFAPRLKQRLMRNFPEAFTKDGKGCVGYGDPTGDSKGQATDATPYTVFHAHGIPMVMAPGNNVLSIRLGAIETQLDKSIGGVPGILISPACRMLKTAMSGGYHFRKKKGTGVYHEEPDKDRMADYADALQYAALGAGLGVAYLTPGHEKPRPKPGRRQKRYSLRKR